MRVAIVKEKHNKHKNITNAQLSEVRSLYTRVQEGNELNWNWITNYSFQNNRGEKLTLQFHGGTNE